MKGMSATQVSASMAYVWAQPLAKRPMSDFLHAFPNRMITPESISGFTSAVRVVD